VADLAGLIGFLPLNSDLGGLGGRALSFRRILLIGLAIVLVALIGGAVALSRMDLAKTASDYLTDRLGRKLTIASARLQWGDPVRVELSGVTLANMPGGSQPHMITLSRLTADISPFSLMFGPQVVRHLTLDGTLVLLERGPGDVPNWRLSPPVPRIAGQPEARLVLPTLLDAHFHNVEIDVRTSSGNLLRTRLDDFAVTAAATDAPVRLTGDGSYNGIAVHVDAKLPAFARLHTDTRTFPVSIKLSSGTTNLALNGNARDPLNFDGIDGRIVLNAPKPQELLALAGLTGNIDVPLTLAGTFKRSDTLWQVSNSDGTLDKGPIKANLTLQEGQRHQLDAVTVDAAFQALDIDKLVPSADPKQPRADKMSLRVDPAPGALLDIHIAAGHVAYRTIQADKFDFKMKVAPGQVSIEQLALEIAGGSAHSKVTIANRDTKATIDFDGSLTGVDAARLSQLMGWGKMPIGGPITSHVTGSMTGATIAEAREANRIFGVLTMTGGTIDRQLVSLASTDVRSLFGGRPGSARLDCLLVILNLADGKGTIAPLRIKTSDGTITGAGYYDARRDYLDMTIGTQSSTTGFFSLDVPVRISGPVTDFSVSPAFGASRRLTATGKLAELPSDMQAFAGANACAAA
jgi:uncharacterized protein involved in outer membrane biogenesis